MQAASGQIDLTIQTASQAPFQAEIVDLVKDTEGVAVVDASLHRTVILPESLAPAATSLTSAGNISRGGCRPGDRPAIAPVPGG